MAGRTNDGLGNQKIDGICQNFDSSKTDGSLSSTSDNLSPLPENWKKAYTENGEPYFIDYNTGSSQWQDPRLGKLNLGVNNGEENELPYGWEKIEDPHYGTYYIDHVNKTTQYESPTLHTVRNVQQEEVSNSTDWRQMGGNTLPGNNVNTKSEASDSQSLQSQDGGYLNNRKLNNPGSDRNMRLPELNSNNTMQKLPYIFTRNPYELRGEMIQTTLVKSGRGFGFTIVGGDNGDVEEFLQIKNIVPHGPAWQNGVLQTGDVLVYVNNTCVLGYTHQDVVTLFQSMSPGDNVQLEVCRGYPLPFDLSDPNAEVVSTVAVSMNQSPETRPNYPSGGSAESEKESYFKLDEGSDSARSAKSMPDLRNSNHSKIQRHNSANILDTTMSDEMATYNQQGCDTLEYITVEIIKGNNGFGFTIADSGCGQKVKKILDKSRCQSLQEGDILLDINGKNVTDLSHTDVVLMLKECPCGEGARITVQRGVPKGNKFARSYENSSYQMDGNSNLLSQSLLLPDKLKQKDLSVPSVPGLYRSKTPTADLYSTRNKDPIPVNRPKTPLVDSRNWFPADPCRGYNGTMDHEILSMWKTGFRIKSPNSPHPNWSPAQDQGYWSNKSFQECNKVQDCSPHDDVRLPTYKEIAELEDDTKSIHSNSRNMYSNNWNRNNLGNLNASPQSYPSTYSNRCFTENNYPIYHSEGSDHHPLHDNIGQQPMPQESNSCNLHYQYSSNHSLSPTRTNNSFEQEQQPLLSKTMGDDSEYNLYGGQSPQERMPVPREMTVTLHRQESGFGFRIVGGTEEGSQVSIGHIVPGGAADLDGRLQPGDEIISVDGQSVINTTHHQVVQLMGSASSNDRVTLGIRRKLPVRDVDKIQDSYHSNCSGNIYPYNVTVTRKQNEGFGFVIISSVSRIGSTIGRILENSPAERCNHLHVGDRILAVNGISIINMHHGDIVNLIKDSGYSVTLTIGAPQDDEPSATTNSQKGDEIHRDQQRYHSIELIRGTRGFGFSIRGGQEFQNMPLYVLRIAENGPAHQDGKLHVGDQIMEINGVNTAGMTHAEAIEIIRQGGNTVHLVVKRHDKLPAVIANNPGSLPPEYYSINTHNEIVR